MIYIIEEHNEAFYVFHKYFKSQNEIKTLLHVDEHHDLGTPVVTDDWIDSINNLKLQELITYDELRNCDYIIPLCYQKFIKDVVWLNNKEISHSIDFEIQKVRSVGKYSFLKVNKCLKQSKIERKSKLFFTNIGEQFPFNVDKTKLILSIDLDYFSCSDAEGENFHIEITKSEYDKYIKSNHHPIKLSFGSRMQFYEKNNKYYIEYQAHDGPNENKINSLDKIKKNVIKFKNYLLSNGVRPQDIILCKSSVSNYTPKEQQDIILKLILKILIELYHSNDIINLQRRILD